MALRVGFGGLAHGHLDEPRLLDASRRIVDSRLATIDGARMGAYVFFPRAVSSQLRTGADKGNPTV